MKLVTFFLLIQIGYIIAKATENPHSCSGSAENDPQLKRSDEKVIHSDTEDTTEKDLDKFAMRKTSSKPVDETGDNKDDNGNSKEIASNTNTGQKLPPVNDIKLPAIIDLKGDSVKNNLTTKRVVPLQEPVVYKPVDPKYIVISGLSLPKSNNKIMPNNDTETKDPLNIDVNKTIATLGNLNLTEALHKTSRDSANDTEEEKVINYSDTDITNIRELREHLLDHLLNYFLNIIKEEDDIRNNTRKKNGKDRMKVEEKLSNYYDPHYLDIFFANDDDDYDDNYLDPSDYYRRKNDIEEDLQDNKQNGELNNENMTNIVPPNNPKYSIDKITSQAFKPPENLQVNALHLNKKLNNSYNIPDVDLAKTSPVTTKYINLMERESDFSKMLLDTKEKTADNNSYINLTTIETSTSSESLKTEPTTVDKEFFDYSEEVVADGIEYANINGELIEDDYIYEDSNEFEIVKNVTLTPDYEEQRNDDNPIDIITESSRRKDKVLDEKEYFRNDALNETKKIGNSSQIVTNVKKKFTLNNASLLLENEVQLNTSAKLDRSNKNTDAANLPCDDEDNVSTNKNKDSIKKSKKNKGIKGKFRSNKNCAVSIIFTRQIEAATSITTKNFEDSLEDFVINVTSILEHQTANGNKGNETGSRKKEITFNFDSGSSTNIESNEIQRKKQVYTKFKHKDSKNFDKLQSEEQSDENIVESNTTIASDRNVHETFLSDREHSSNEETVNSEDTSEVNKKLVQAISQVSDTERVKQEIETKVEPTEETSLQKDTEKPKHPDVKEPILRHKHILRFKHRNRTIIPTHTTTKKLPLYKLAKKWDYNWGSQIESNEAISRNNDIYKLKHPDELEVLEESLSKYTHKVKHRNHSETVEVPASKLNNKIKHPKKIDAIPLNNEVNKLKQSKDLKIVEEPKHTNKIKHRDYKNHGSYEKASQDNYNINKLKHRDSKNHGLYEVISRDDDIYKLKPFDDLEIVEESFPKLKNNHEHKSKSKNSIHKIKHHDKDFEPNETVKKDKHSGKTKQAEKKLVSNKREFDSSKTLSNTRQGRGQIDDNPDSKDNWAPSDEVDIQKLITHGEKKLDSYEELLKQNDLLDNPQLPFYISSSTIPVTRATTTKKHVKKRIDKKDAKAYSPFREYDTTTLLHDHIKVLREKYNLKNHKIDINSTLERLASSKLLDLLTERVAGQMLKKLQTRFKSKNLRTLEVPATKVEPESIEQIEILFKNDGDMVVSRELKRKDGNGSLFY